MKINKITSLYDIECQLAPFGYSGVVNSIAEQVAREEKRNNKRVSEKLICERLNGYLENLTEEAPKLGFHRLSYFLFWHLVRELEAIN